ncbi:hypothetical protein ABZ719_32950 [Streptomyces sp. NPDC006743]|uniref:hypothetical protein n=1 Tax=Streptomyces sp. NPDC006743 TaxID=3154480 RepID=UPI0034569503
MVVAVLLLPLVGVLLLVMDRIEDRMSGAAPARGRPARHLGHLRLIPGGRREGARDPGSAASGTAEQEEPHGPADVAGRPKTGTPQEAGDGAARRREAGVGRDRAA